MVNKTLIQIFLFLLVLISLIIFYKTYFNKVSIVETKTDIYEENKTNNSDTNVIYDLNYSATDIDNNEYIINSSSGEMSENGTELLMNNVNAKIILNDKTEILIFAKNALYNKDNYNTKFYGKVIVKYGIQTIFAEKMDLNFEINQAKIYNDVVFENLNTKIKTDILEFDLITKNVLIKMKDKTKRVNIDTKF